MADEEQELELKSWVVNNGLSENTATVLVENGFTSLDSLKELSLEDLAECLLNSKLMPARDFMKLKKALTNAQLGATSTSPTLAATPMQSEILSPFAGGYAEKTEVSPSDSLQTFSSGTVKAKATIFDRPDKPVAPGKQYVKDMREAAPTQKQTTGLLKSVKNRFLGKDTKPITEVFRFIMVGKTGSGKSTTGNTIFGEKKFASAVRFSSVTTECELHRVDTGERRIEIMDCPGLYDTNRSQQDIAVTIVQAVACTHPGPHAILYVMRLGRYTAEEFGVYQRLKVLFDDQITHYLIVLFTGGDDLEKEGKTLADLLGSAPRDLLTVMEECNRRCLLFNNHTKHPKPQVEELFKMVKEMNAANKGNPYTCPKYITISEGMEEEVNRRLESVLAKDLEREKYVKELEAKAEAAEQALKDAQNDFNRKEDERNQQEKDEQQRYVLDKERLEQEFQAKMKEHQEQIKEKEQQLEKAFQKRKQEENELERKQESAEIEMKRKIEEEKYKTENERLERELRQRAEEKQNQLESDLREFQKKLEEERQQERETLRRREEEREETEKKKREEERLENERRERARQEELERLKDRIATNEEPDFVEWVVGGISSGISKFFNWIVS